MITNTFKDEKINYPVEKKWLEVDAEKTPDSIEVELLRDGTQTGTKATLKKMCIRDSPVAKTDISGTKTWVDDSNADTVSYTHLSSTTARRYRNIILQATAR